MNHIFLSHVEEDACIALEIALHLEEAGYKAWCYELDSLSCSSYAQQVVDMISECQAFLILISPQSIGSIQVDRELHAALQDEKLIVPVQHGITYEEFMVRRPTWRYFLESTSSVTIPLKGFEDIMPFIIGGLEAAHIDPMQEPRKKRIRLIRKRLGDLQESGSEPKPGIEVTIKYYHDCVNNLNKLAELYIKQRNYEKARPLFSRALEIQERAMGPDHPDVARSLNNLAWIYRSQSKYDQALHLYTRALEIRERALGSDHPDVARSVNNLAWIYRSQGKYDQALHLYTRALEIRERALGPDHPDVARSLNNLALIYKNQGKYDQAHSLQKRSLEISERALGPDHPDVARNLNNLAGIYESQGKYDQALPLYTRALEIRERTLGPDHPETVRSLSKRKKVVKRTVSGHQYKTIPEVSQNMNNMTKRDSIPAIISGAFGPVFNRRFLERNAPSRIMDKVTFTVTAPSTVEPGSAFVVDLWAHLELQREDVIEIAKQEAKEAEFMVKSKGPVQVPRGTMLTVRLDLEDFIVDDPWDTILWDAEIGKATFGVRALDDAKYGPRHGLAEIFRDNLRTARIYFILQVGKKSVTIDRIPAREERYRTAFASYASADRDDVSLCIQGLKKGLPEIDIFWDRDSLRSGQKWEKELRRVIPLRDIFYLFWSANAKKSEWVEKEWRYALKKRGLDFIDPFPLVSPDEVPPPKELASLHFYDRWVAYRRRRASNGAN